MGGQDISQLSQILRKNKNNLSYQVKITPQQASGMLLIYYTKLKSSDSP